MPKRPEDIEARSPRRFLVEGEADEDVQLREDERIRADIERKRQAKEEEQREAEKVQRRRELSGYADALLERLESKWEESLDHMNLDHEYFIIDAFDQENWFWWLNYVLMTKNADDPISMGAFDNEYSSESESEEFDQRWNSLLYDEFNNEERDVIKQFRRGNRYEEILQNAYEGFGEEWISAENYNLDDVYKNIPLLAWRPEVYYIVRSDERREFVKEAEKFLSHGALTDLLADAGQRGCHLARIGSIFNGKELAHLAFFRGRDEELTPVKSTGETYLKICDGLGNCVHRISGQHITFKPHEGWEIDIGKKSFGAMGSWWVGGRKIQFERSTKVQEDTWYWSLDPEPEDERKIREEFAPTIPGTRGRSGWRLLPEGRYGFNIPSY